MTGGRLVPLALQSTCLSAFPNARVPNQVRHRPSVTAKRQKSRPHPKLEPRVPPQRTMSVLAPAVLLLVAGVWAYAPSVEGVLVLTWPEPGGSDSATRQMAIEYSKTKTQEKSE